ncbi:terminase, small subunit [Maritalea myrionectae]|uniref:Terminase, small subunit n=1 Tax=Maritalea myrionectae TaxID=454601 RepID=A0A2R4MDW9_9HYPH|nr:DNA-packaging protein [Maritalea myrionectae]AVX04227.1 terminase, small subunit [Maritalea myrionectae]
MAAPLGNSFWKARSSHGRKPIFESPDQLEKACQEYFDWVEANPLYEIKPFNTKGGIVQEPVAKMRAMTIAGLCIFLDIGQTTWSEYKANKDFAGVITQVEDIIRTQKFAGAAADLLNPNIIARDLGLADKKEHSGPEGGPMEHKASDKDLARAIATILAKGIKIEPDA